LPPLAGGGLTPEAQAVRTAGGGDAAFIADDSPAATAGSAAGAGPQAPTQGGGVAKPAAVPDAPAAAPLALPCDALFTAFHSEPSHAGGWSLRLADVPAIAEDLTVSAAALAFVFCGLPDRPSPSDDKRRRLAPVA